MEPETIVMRPSLMRPIPILTAVVLAASLGACGSTGESRADDTPADESGTALAITFRSAPDSAEEQWELTCGPTGGTHPMAEAACRHLDKAADEGKDLFAPPPRDQMCAEVFSGPQRATVKGTFRGKPVNASYARNNSCETERWDKMGPVIDPPR
jgi:hypothetical protein